MTDVIVIGGGVIGLSVAYELVNRGLSVSIFDRQHFGKEASWAGAGMLPPANGDVAVNPEIKLRAASNLLWSNWSEQLKEESGIDNGFRNCGGIQVLLRDDPEEWKNEIQLWKGNGAIVEELDLQKQSFIEPNLGPEIKNAFRLPEMCQVRNPRHLKALLAACTKKDVALFPGLPVLGFQYHRNRIEGVRTSDGIHHADHVIVTGGAWSPEILGPLGIDCQLIPVRGQIVLLSMPVLPFNNIIEEGSRYLVPRLDGKILIGSTEEHVGFNKENTAEGIASLLQFAQTLVPALKNAKYEQAWAGLRPRSVDGKPYLGKVGEYENLYLAAGHFRDGLQLSPITAQLIAQQIFDQPINLPIDAFACDRGVTIDLERMENGVFK